jgi:hypothetical protein
MHKGKLPGGRKRTGLNAKLKKLGNGNGNSFSTFAEYSG